MTRRDYVLISGIIADVAEEAANPLIDGESMRVHIATLLAAALARQNEGFDRARFLKACGAGV